MNVTLTRSKSRQFNCAKTIQPIKYTHEQSIKKSKSNANLFSKGTSMNVYTKKAMDNINNLTKQNQAKRRNRYQIEYESEYNKQFAIPRSIPQVIKQQYMTQHLVDTNRILFPDDEYDNDSSIFTTYHKGKKRHPQLRSSGSITELFEKGKETKIRRKISGKQNEEHGIFGAEFRKSSIKKEKKPVDLEKVKKDSHYAGNFNSVYDLWYKLSIKARNKEENKTEVVHRALNASDYARMIKLKSRESDLFGTHTTIPRNRQGKHCNYFNKSVIF